MPNAGEDQLAQLQRRAGARRRTRGHRLRPEHRRLSRPQRSRPRVRRLDSGDRRTLHYFQIGSGQDRGAVWMGGALRSSTRRGTSTWRALMATTSVPASRTTTATQCSSCRRPCSSSRSSTSTTGRQLSARTWTSGPGTPRSCDGFVFQVGKTDTAYLLRQGHLGGEDGEVASLSVCSGDPDGGHAVLGSVVYVPCPNGVTAVRVSAKAPYLKQLWTDDDGAAGGPIIADGLVWTIGATTRCTASTRPTATGRLDSLRRVGEPLPDAVGRRWPAAPSGNRPGHCLHGSGRAAAGASLAEALLRWPSAGQRDRQRPADFRRPHDPLGQAGHSAFGGQFHEVPGEQGQERRGCGGGYR